MFYDNNLNCKLVNTYIQYLKKLRKIIVMRTIDS